MKKSLLILPLAAMLLAGCNLISGGSSGGKKKKSSSSEPAPSGEVSNSDQSGQTTTGGGQTTTGGGQTTTAGPTVGPVTPDLPTEHEASFAPNMTAGEHTVTFDFNANYTAYKEAFPYVAIDTGLIGIHLDGMAIMSVDCFASQGYQGGANYLMMRNKKDSDDWASANGAAFIGNCVALGTISKVSITRGASASTAQRYYVTFSNSLDTAPATTGTELEGTGDEATNTATGMTFFKITTKDKTKNGQIQSLTVTYTV